MTAALVSEGRCHFRPNSMLAGSLSAGGSIWAVTIRNLSVRGASIEGEISVDIGTSVVLSRGPHQVAGEVRWQSARSVGIWFHEPVNVADWLQSVDSSGTEPAEKESSNSGGRHFDDLPSSIIASRVREEMAFVARLVEGVAELLSEDPILRVRHATRIQELCMGEQMLNELSAVLELGCSADAVFANVSEPMRQRLLRARMRGLGACH
jgi:hypothetical protein